MKRSFCSLFFVVSVIFSASAIAQDSLIPINQIRDTQSLGSVAWERGEYVITRAETWIKVDVSGEKTWRTWSKCYTRNRLSSTGIAEFLFGKWVYTPFSHSEKIPTSIENLSAIRVENLSQLMSHAENLMTRSRPDCTVNSATATVLFEVETPDGYKTKYELTVFKENGNLVVYVPNSVTRSNVRTNLYWELPISGDGVSLTANPSSRDFTN